MNEGGEKWGRSNENEREMVGMVNKGSGKKYDIS